MVLRDEPQDMKNQINPNWLSADVQAHIEIPPIKFAKTEDNEELKTNIIKVNM